MGAADSTMDFAELTALAAGHVDARTIQVAVKIGVFEALAEQERDVTSLAGALGCDARAIGLLTNALVALGLLIKDSGRYRLAAAARRFLVESSDEYLGGMILFDEALFRTWSDLEQSVRSGIPARTPDMFQTNPEETERFIRAMDSLTRARGDARHLAERLDLSRVARMADVGGGPGTYLVEFLRRWPRMRGAIYDLPATLAVARRILAEREPWALQRIELVTVNYLADDLPGPCDALFLSNVIHSEDEAANQALMEKCFRALSSGGTVIIKDHIMSRDLTSPRAGALFSLHLLLTTRGRDYGFDEVERWLAQAGFTDIVEQVLPSPPFTSSIVTGRRP
jgi:SAM-dependent methyltransferase